MCVYHYDISHNLISTVVGTSNVVIISIGGDTRITSLPLGAYFMGPSLISCVITAPLFRRAGRKKKGFLTGNAFGLVATVLGAVSLLVKSPALNTTSTFFFGAANGIGFFLRFAAVENVPTDWAGKAVALVISGGVLGAFAGPETAQATRGIFNNDDNDENMLYMGGLSYDGDLQSSKHRFYISCTVCDAC